MSLFEHPHGLELVKHFSIPDSQTWGSGPKRDNEIKARLRKASGLAKGDGDAYEWFVFSIRVYVGRELTRRRGNKPDVENFPKLIVDAFTGILYEDDHLITCGASRLRVSG